MKNAAPLRAMFKWQFGARSENSGPRDQLVEGAMRCTEFRALECGSVRSASRMTRRRPRAFVFAFSSKVAPDHLAVEPYRLLQGGGEWGDMSGALCGGAGFV